MKKLLLFILLFTAIHLSSFSKEDMYTDIAGFICECLQASEVKPDMINDNKIYKTCIVAKIGPYKRELKKIVKKSIKQGMNEDSSETDALEQFNKQLDIALHKKCPDISKSILDNLNLFTED